MRLPAIFLTILLAGDHTFGQFDYELFEKFATTQKKKLNSRLVNVTEFMQDDQNRWNKKSFNSFNEDGLPVLLIQYNEQAKEDEKKEFLYGAGGRISKIKTIRYGNPIQSTEFTTDQEGKLISCTEYMLNEENDLKILFSKTIVEYGPGNLINRLIKLQGREMDTARIDYFDEAGIKMSSINREMWPNIIRTEYKWNADKTEMKEISYQGQGEKDTVVHFYRNGKEVGMINSSIPPYKFYWKYNNAGSLMETNEANFVQTFTYTERGYLKTMTNLRADPEPNVREQANKQEYKYEYQYRH